MSYGIRVHVWGDRACFTRPEMKAERVSYDVMTPSAARGLLESIYWKPAITWVIDAITVVNEIRFDTFRRNELGSMMPKGSVVSAMRGADARLAQVIEDDRQQRATLCLRDVAYVIEAHFVLTDRAGADETKEKHYAIASRRLRRGQYYQHPYFGCREFAAEFALLDEGEAAPESFYAGSGERDLGYMLYDIDFANGMNSRFFRAIMCDGVVDVRSQAQVVLA